MKNRFYKILLIANIILTFPIFTMAEDIDLFVTATPAKDVPNVLIILDNTANWNTAFTAEMNALKTTLSAIANKDGTANFNIGLMLFAEGNLKGGYVRAAIRPLDSLNQSKYVNLINSLSVNSDKGTNAAYGLSMAEAYRYFLGLNEYIGADEPKRDYPGNTTGNAASNAIYSLPDNAFASATSKVYTNPIKSTCAKNYIIFISNGKIDANDKDDTSPQCASNLKACTAKDLLKIAGGDINPLAISPSGESLSMANEWSRFMKKSNANIVTYTIDVGTQNSAHAALLNSMADVSDGEYFAAGATSDEIANALMNVFSKVQSVNSVFASVSLPVNVNTQGIFLNQVFIGMFRPDQTAKPRWNGNLKQYKLGFIGDGDKLQLLDADNKGAINADKGLITECARSYWTPQTLDSYWAFRPQGCLNTNAEISNSPDGNIVEKGAQGYKLRNISVGAASSSNPNGTTSRNMKTCTLGLCTSAGGLTDFNKSNPALNAVSLDLNTPTEVALRDSIIDWQRGLETKNENENDNNVVVKEMRASTHGDVIHSSPVAINYGAVNQANRKVVVFYGGNDGVLRAVNGNRDGELAIGAKEPGNELWSFVPPEFYKKIKRIYQNTAVISFPGTSGTPKDYGFDGPITAFKDSTTAAIYASMRRGGRALYAFDVTTPETPTLKWMVGCPNAAGDTGCTDTRLAGIGQTWASAKVIKTASSTKPMLIMGGGYDVCQDTPNQTVSSSTCSYSTSGTLSKGNKIFVLDSDTGAVLRVFGSNTLIGSSIIADITVIPDSIGNIQFAYAADLGGNIYRISGVDANTSIGNASPDKWTITQIASLGGTGNNNRKFMFSPDVLNNNDGSYTLLIGSGDREKPLASFSAAMAVNNYFFRIDDKPSDKDWLSKESSNCSGQSLICMKSLFAITDASTPTADQLLIKKGWALAMAPTEQVVTSAITVFGTVTFSTFQPTLPKAGTCSSLGLATVYNLNYVNASTKIGNVRGEVIAGGGLPPSPVAGMVTLDNGKTVPFIIGASPTSPLQAGNPIPPKSVKKPKSRVFWNIKK